MTIQGKKKINLTTENILSIITSYDIFRYYMPNKSWKLNVATNSPFRKDDSPSFIIGNKYGEYTYKDFGDSDKKGNCFKFVQQLYNCDFRTSLEMINRDFGLGLYGDAPTIDYKVITSKYEQPEEFKEKKYSIIQAVTRKFRQEELDYWNQYHLDVQDLKDNNIYSVSKVYLNKQLFHLKETDLRFGYFYNGHWKIYRPYVTPKFKWIPNNVPITALDGELVRKEQPLLIQKSKKDYMVMKKLYPHCIAVQNEDIGCFSEENVEIVTSISDKQILMFDSDPTGVKNSKKITEQFGFDYLNVPRTYLSDGIKDFADLAKDYGMSTIEKILKKKKLL